MNDDEFLGLAYERSEKPDRIITITDGHETWEMPFDSVLLTDSEALHHLLCRVHPGYVYSVSFKKKEN